MMDKTLHILIIDDDTYLSDMYALKFEQGGHAVKAVQSTSEASVLIENPENRFDIIIFDLVMPGVDGFEYIEELKNSGRLEGVCSIILTNQSRDQDIERAQALGVDGYIVKASSIPSEVIESVMSVFSQEKTGELFIRR